MIELGSALDSTTAPPGSTVVSRSRCAAGTGGFPDDAALTWAGTPVVRGADALSRRPTATGRGIGAKRRRSH